MEEQKHNEPVAEPAVPEAIKHDVDYDRSDPRALLIAGLGICSIIGLVLVILGVQAYFDHIREEEAYQSVYAPVAQQLQDLHAKEAEELNTYKYLDRNKGTVQIPISRAMQLLAEEAANHKLTYFQKPTPVKPVEGGAAASATAQPNGTAGAVKQAAPAAGAGAGPSSANGSKANK
jgi:hypothetical protein